MHGSAQLIHLHLQTGQDLNLEFHVIIAAKVQGRVVDLFCHSVPSGLLLFELWTSTFSSWFSCLMLSCHQLEL